jgi:hypothetical protein
VDTCVAMQELAFRIGDQVDRLESFICVHAELIPSHGITTASQVLDFTARAAKLRSSLVGDRELGHRPGRARE